MEYARRMADDSDRFAGTVEGLDEGDGTPRARSRSCGPCCRAVGWRASFETDLLDIRDSVRVHLRNLNLGLNDVLHEALRRVDL